MKELADQMQLLVMSVANIGPGMVYSTFEMFKNVKGLGFRGISSVGVLKEVASIVSNQKNFPNLQYLEVHSEFDLSHADPIVNEEDGSKVTAMDLYLKICGIRRPKFELRVGFILGACSTTNSALIEKEREFIINIGKISAELLADLELTHYPPSGDYDPLTSLLYENAVLRALSAFTVRSTLYTLPDDVPWEDEIDIFNTPSTPAESPSTETQSTTAILEEQLQIFMNALCNNPNAAFQPPGRDQPLPVHCRYNAKKVNSSKVSGSLHKFAIYPTPFIHAFQRHVTDHSALFTQDPTSKADYRLVHTFLLQHACFQRYNDHGSKCKSEGKLVWYTHGRYSNETESWTFEPVQPRIVSSVPTLVKCGDQFTWNAQVAHPRVQSTSLRVSLQSNSLPDWLRIKEDSLVGQVPQDATGKTSFAVDVLVHGSKSTPVQILPVSFDITIQS
ncbi:hypothetical protein GQ42DRAFT_154699 [Ramicandelaber brevisporus]|nr:hypothetical protein GQ42DRAFT_154699 [Ramicandelaber brevisporus]